MAIVGRRQDVALVCKHCKLPFPHVCEKWVNMVLDTEVLSYDAGDGYVYLRCPTCKQYEESGHQCSRGRVRLERDDPAMCKQIVLMDVTFFQCYLVRGHAGEHQNHRGDDWTVCPSERMIDGERRLCARPMSHTSKPGSAHTDADGRIWVATAHATKVCGEVSPLGAVCNLAPGPHLTHDNKAGQTWM